MLLIRDCLTVMLLDLHFCSVWMHGERNHLQVLLCCSARNLFRVNGPLISNILLHKWGLQWQYKQRHYSEVLCWTSWPSPKVSWHLECSQQRISVSRSKILRSGDQRIWLFPPWWSKPYHLIYYINYIYGLNYCTTTIHSETCCCHLQPSIHQERWPETLISISTLGFSDDIPGCSN